MPSKMILEARINEYAMRDQNPHVPWTPDEIADTAARCREAGASIVHFHARNPDGSPNTAHTTNLVEIIYVAEDSAGVVHDHRSAPRAE